MKIILFSLFVYALSYSFSSYMKVEKLKKEINICSHKIDSLVKVKSCYCKKLEFLDTLTEEECEKAFKKSRGLLR